ncbi:unnamed protein product [Lepidochelys olivacea]
MNPPRHPGFHTLCLILSSNPCFPLAVPPPSLLPLVHLYPLWLLLLRDWMILLSVVVTIPPSCLVASWVPSPPSWVVPSGAPRPRSPRSRGPSVHGWCVPCPPVRGRSMSPCPWCRPIRVAWSMVSPRLWLARSVSPRPRRPVRGVSPSVAGPVSVAPSVSPGPWCLPVRVARSMVSPCPWPARSLSPGPWCLPVRGPPGLCCPVRGWPGPWCLPIRGWPGPWCLPVRGWSGPWCLPVRVARSVVSPRPCRPVRGCPRRRLPGRLGRSESLRVAERKRSLRGSAKGKQPRSRSDVDLEAAARARELQERPPLGPGRPRPGGSTPEPGGAGGGEPPPSFLPPQSEETEPRVSEPEPPTWRQRVPPNALLRLKKGEVKRQEVINELFLTEHAHVRMLRVLLELFYQPLLSEGFFLEAELTNIFPSLEEMTDEHTKFLENLKKLRDESDCIIAEIGDVLLARFDGTEGGWFQKLSARFCSRQSFALEQLKAKQRKETRFSQFIQEAESQARCRRLQLKDIIPIEMQRLTKYPLLLENIAKYTEEEKERGKVQRAAECCRQILNHVNQEVREMENLMKLKDYQKRLDLSSLKQSTDPLLSEFKNTDITKRNLVHEGDLTWRVSKDKAVDVHMLLLDDILVLLQRQEERLVLRCHSRPPGPTPETRQVLSPIIKLSSAMTRDVATDRKAFYVIFSWENGAQIYELVAQTVSERKNWCDLINETAGSLKLPGSNRQKPRRAAPSLSAPHSPSYDRERLLSSSENGNSPRETLHSDEREKEGALEGMEFEERGPEKQEKDSERILAELLALHKPRAAGEGGLAAAALERVSELKRLLVGGSPLLEDGDPGSPEDGWHQAPENRGARDEDKERDAGDGAESEGGAPGGGPNGPGSLDWGLRGPGGAGPGSPLVLTPRQSEDVRRSCQHLEEVVCRLKDMEDAYSQLQQLLDKCSCPPSPHFT